MGQANKRGDFEKRKQQSIQRRAAEVAEAEREHQEYEASLTPEFKANRAKKRLELASIMTAVGMFAGSGRY